MKLVEQELWQREEKGLIGILPVRDTAEVTTVGPLLSQGDRNFLFVALAPLLGLVHYIFTRLLGDGVNPFRCFGLILPFSLSKMETEELLLFW